jgi:hypothetical protein
MNKTASFLVLAGASVLLAGCGSSGLFNRDRPDEFAVQRQAPLIVPPDFSLTPPQPGAPRAVDRNTQQQTLDTLFGGQAPRSDVEKNTVGRAGISAPGIRSAVGDPSTNTVAKGETTRDVLAAPQGDGREAQVSAGS